MPLASSQDFLAASKANPVFAKYAGKPSGLQSKAPAPINTQAANNGTASGSNHAVSNVSTAQAGPLNGTSSGNIIFEAPISASEKMSALTHSSKVDFALDAEMQKLKSEFITLLDKIADLAKKTAATVPVTQPTPPDTPLEALAPQPTENKKAKVTLSEHLANSKTAIPTPHYISNLKSYKDPSLTSTHPPLYDAVAFPLSFLKRHLGGSEYSPGLYYPAHSLTDMLTEDKDARAIRLKRAGSKKVLVKGRPEKETWYAFDKSTNPYVPSKPCTHGAALTPLFHDFEQGSASNAELQARHIDVPLFVALPSTSEDNDTEGDPVDPKPKDFAAEPHFFYMGQYTQSRWSDKLSVSDMTTFCPPSLLRHWAQKLSHKDRPTWMAEQLLPLLDPKPAPDVQPGMKREDVETAMIEHIEDLEEWKKDADKSLNGLTEEEVMSWWMEPDAGERPGLRMWWEWLECTGYDRVFYQSLASIKRKEENANAEEQCAPEDPSHFGNGVIGQKKEVSFANGENIKSQFEAKGFRGISVNGGGENGQTDMEMNGKEEMTEDTW